MTATQVSRYQTIEAELDTFAPADDVQRFSDLCDEQADLYAAVAAVDYELARTL